MQNEAKVSALLQENSSLFGSLLGRVKQIERWNALLAESLPAEEKLWRHCHVVRVEGSKMIIIADSPHWVTRLRFLLPQLLTALRKYPEFEKLQSIVSKVQPVVAHDQKLPARNKPLQISEKSAAVLRETAEKIKKPRLKKALEKIAEKALS